ncbi:chromate transporter [Burkholderia ubonensis]|uniref:Chromate transporter n=1 Tax=Burkholderia ubonensis TaxID=101571 RepID=A0AAW3NIF2_9BURK|nr:chromate transporter [Burkholderia ubonensis]KVL13818.1 chromate transporter [Burkholderia ubonensis]KVN81153.1 chromate transporter [Burkholderia ubonensis]KVQ01799.1 chromate transporter [Burkholderia ubonensis]KVQ56021.1 chromate transporter [Burkholderia ubonensis]KVT63592.1 chromate transporter [Burkholderia ubonensis]
MPAAHRYAALLGVFAPLSIATIGGGQAIIADLQRQVVDVHHWMTATQFVNDFAIARMAPGPGSLLATLIGWQVAGFWGAVIATLALFGPTAFLIYGVAHLWRRHEGARWQIALEAGLRPVAAGMLVASAWVLLQGLDGGWPARALALASTVCVMRTRIHALALIAAGAGLFVALRLTGH